MVSRSNLAWSSELGATVSDLGSTLVGSVGVTSATVWTWVAAFADGTAALVSVAFELVCGRWSPTVYECSPFSFSPRVVTDTFLTGVLNLIKG